jgi:hypothetical protein
MSDNAEMGEQPVDPAARAGVGVGAGPDDYAEGVAEQQMESTGEATNPAGAAQQADGEQPPEEPRTPFADTDAAASRLQHVDNWGTGDGDEPQEPPAAERGES